MKTEWMKTKKRVGTAEELGELICGLPVCSTESDMHMRSAMVSFSFGPRGIIGSVMVEKRVPADKTRRGR